MKTLTRPRMTAKNATKNRRSRDTAAQERRMMPRVVTPSARIKSADRSGITTNGDVKIDFVVGGSAFGRAATRLKRHNFDLDSMRPWLGEDGKSYYTKNVGTIENPVYQAIPTNNANATLRRDQWLEVDEPVVRVAKPAMRAVNDLRAAGLTDTIDGFATPVLAYERVGDITGAIVSMDGLRQSETDRPELDIAYLPIPIIHKDLQFSERQMAVAARAGRPMAIDRMTLELASIRVAEVAEQMLIGTFPSFSYGGGTIYGYTNWPGRITKTLTNPTDAAWTPQTTFVELLEMRQALVNKFRNGPYMLYVSSDWDIVFDDDYSSAYAGPSLRDKIRGIDRITDVRTLDFLTGYQMILVHFSRDVIEEVVGMELRVVEWTDGSGMEQYYKVMAILVPRIRTDMDSNSGIVHGNAP